MHGKEYTASNKKETLTLHVDSNYNTQRTRDKYKHTNLEIMQFDYDKRGKRKKKLDSLIKC